MTHEYELPFVESLINHQEQEPLPPLILCLSSSLGFGSHAMSGIAGNILAGLFVQASVAGADGITTIPGGWLLRSTRYPALRLCLQPCSLFRHDGESYHLTTLFFYLTIYPSADHHIVDHALHSRFRLHCDKETEILGIDDAEMGEFAYDYVGIESKLMPRSEYNIGASGKAFNI